MATKDRLLNTVQSMRGYERQPSEIKSAKLDPDTLGTVLDRLQSEVYDDDSLVTAENHLPWAMSFPVGFTIAPLHGGVCRAVLDDQLSRLSAFEAMQVMGLSSVLAPLTNRRALLDDESYDEIRVLLDATTWGKRGERRGKCARRGKCLVFDSGQQKDAGHPARRRSGLLVATEFDAGGLRNGSRVAPRPSVRTVSSRKPRSHGSLVPLQRGIIDSRAAYLRLASRAV
jgi:hypothetical protein